MGRLLDTNEIEELERTRNESKKKLSDIDSKTYNSKKKRNELRHDLNLEKSELECK